MKKIKPTHGGARPGAGRKTTQIKPYTIRVTEEERDLILFGRKKKGDNKKPA